MVGGRRRAGARRRGGGVRDAVRRARPVLAAADRRFRIRLSHPYAGTASSTAPLAATQRRVLLSPAYRAVDGLLRSDIHDYWDDEDWRFLSYTARYDGRRATAVFAVPHHDSTPESIRVAVVDDTSGLTLYRPAVLATA